MQGTKLTAFTDVLIELADPACAREFKKDPSAFLRGRGLARHEEEALIHGNANHIRYFAKGGHYPFDAAKDKPSPAVEIVSLDILEVTTNSQINVAAPETEPDKGSDPNKGPKKPSNMVIIGRDSAPYLLTEKNP